MTLSQNRAREFFPPKWERVLLMQAVYFGLGLLISQGTVFESYAPFGAALVAAAPFNALIAAAGGAALGYLLPFGIGDGVRYLAAVLACAPSAGH